MYIYMDGLVLYEIHVDGKFTFVFGIYKKRERIPMTSPDPV